MESRICRRGLRDSSIARRISCLDLGAQRHLRWIVFHAYAGCIREPCARSLRWAFPYGGFALCPWADVQANARKLATCPAAYRLLAASPFYRSVLSWSIVYRETATARARCPVMSRDSVCAAINHRVNRPDTAGLARGKRRRGVHDIHRANGLADSPRSVLSLPCRPVAVLANCACRDRNHRHQRRRRSLQKRTTICVYRVVLVSDHVGAGHRNGAGRTPGTCRQVYLSSTDWTVRSGKLE